MPTFPVPDPSRRTRSWRRRLLVPVVILGIVAVFGPTWANEPLRRRRLVARTPIQLVPGATATASFTPQRDGKLMLAIQVEVVGDTEWLWDLLETRSDDPEGPLPLSMAYEVRSGSRVVGSATKGISETQRGKTGSVTMEFATHQAASVPHAATVTLVAVPPELAGLSAEFVVGPSGDWISYAWLDALIRQAALAVVVIAVLVWVLVDYLLARSRARRERLFSS